MRRTWWILALPVGLWLAGCNVPCQTYCEDLTHFYEACVVPDDENDGNEDVSWSTLGAEGAADYQQKCLDRFESALMVARTEDRNLIYDWCTNATAHVAMTSKCTDLTFPEKPDLGSDGSGGDEPTDEFGF